MYNLVRAHQLTATTLLGAAFFLWFSLGVEHSGLTTAYMDPVSRVPAQDEAVYSHEAITMSESGNWLTPVFLGRYALNKPPLLQWLTAASVRIFGISAWALRLPSLLAASTATALIFWAVWRLHSLLTACAAVLLLASSHLFYVFSRLTMTDMLLTLCVTVPLVTALRDPSLARTSSLFVFSIAAGAAVLTKAAAGLLPLIALAVYAAVAPRALRPAWWRVLSACAIAAAIALPWHFFQFVIHRKWFVAEYILTQHLAVGLTAPPQYSSENHILFYLRRLWLTDPVLVLAAAASLPWLVRHWRKHSVVLVWAAVSTAAVLAFRYQAAYYILPLLPMLAIMAAAGFASVGSKRCPPLRLQGALVGVLLASAAIKTASAAEPWGIPAGTISERPVTPSLDRYCAQHRANDLIIITGDDQFYASDLPLAHLRYCWLDKEVKEAAAPQQPLDFAWLGISVTVPQFQRLDSLLPVWRERLADFGLASDAPVATSIFAESLEDIRSLIDTHPQSDFWIPAPLLRSLNLAPPHQLVPSGGDGVFLLARHSSFFATGRPCHL
jgi:Dolichyl-phosphate-mannose-protein mannosyltransferase